MNIEIRHEPDRVQRVSTYTMSPSQCSSIHSESHTFHHFVKFFTNAFSANLSDDGVLYFPVLHGFLYFFDHSEAKSAGEAYTPDYSQRIVLESFERGQWSTKNSVPKVFKTLDKAVKWVRRCLSHDTPSPCNLRPSVYEHYKIMHLW